MPFLKHTKRIKCRSKRKPKRIGGLFTDDGGEEECPEVLEPKKNKDLKYM